MVDEENVLSPELDKRGKEDGVEVEIAATSRPQRVTQNCSTRRRPQKKRQYTSRPDDSCSSFECQIFALLGKCASALERSDASAYTHMHIALL